MTIKLYGITISNYYNMVKLSLMEKGLEFEEVTERPNQEPGYLAKSPMGKVPCIETDGGFLAETHVILDYLEELQPSPSLYPSNPYARAKARQVMSICELYIDLVARRHLASVIFGAPRSQEAMEEVRPAMKAGLSAFANTATFTPYVGGDKFGFADIYTYYTFSLAGLLMKAVYEWDIIAEVPGLADNLNLTRERKTTQQCDSAAEQALAAMQA